MTTFTPNELQVSPVISFNEPTHTKSASAKKLEQPNFHYYYTKLNPTVLHSDDSSYTLTLVNLTSMDILACKILTVTVVFLATARAFHVCIADLLCFKTIEFHDV